MYEGLSLTEMGCASAHTLSIGAFGIFACPGLSRPSSSNQLVMFPQIRGNIA